MLRGFAAIFFGALCILWPGITLMVAIGAFGAYALVDGVIAFVTAVRGGSPSSRWWLTVVGTAGATFGFLTLLWPRMTELGLLLFIAAWALIRGAFEILGALALRRDIADEWLLGVAGALSVVFGVVLWMQPQASAVAAMWIVGTYGLVVGGLMVGLSLRVSYWARARARDVATAAPARIQAPPGEDEEITLRPS